MDTIKAKLAINANEISDAEISEEAKQYLYTVADIKNMDEQFWDDFKAGAFMWCLMYGSVGIKDLDDI